MECITEFTELGVSRENCEVRMCLSNAKRTCTNVTMKVTQQVLPRLNEQQCQYLETELTKAMDTIAEHMLQEGHILQVQFVAAKELECAVTRAENLLKQCSYENWLLKAVEMGNSGEHFVEVLLDLQLATDLLRWGSRRMELEEMLSSWQRWLEALREKGDLRACRENDKRRLLERVNEEVVNSNKPKGKRHLAYLLLHQHEPHFSWHPRELETYVRKFQLSTRTKNIDVAGPMVVVKFPWMDRQFALKMPLPRVQHDSNKISHEASLLQKYGNPNIVGFVGHWTIPVTHNYCRRVFHQSTSSAKLVPLLLMENMEITLRELLDKVQVRQHSDMNERGLSPPEVINLMLPVAKALNYLHGKEVAHRDLKPQNIMCTLKCDNFDESRPLDGITVKLIDFGDARELGAHGNISSLPIGRAGTTGYMAPEMQSLTGIAGCTNGNDDIDLLKGDIFSFGMVLGEVFTNRPPLEALGSGKLTVFWNKLKQGERPNIPDHFPLSFITRSCWDANPRHRPQAEDICRMLSHAKLFLSGNVFCTAELTKVFSFEDHDGVIRHA